MEAGSPRVRVLARSLSQTRSLPQKVRLRLQEPGQLVLLCWHQWAPSWPTFNLKCWEFLFSVLRLSIRYRSCIFHSCILHSCIFYSHIFSAATFSDTNFKGRGTQSPQFLRDGSPNYTNFLEDIHSWSLLFWFVLAVRYFVSFRNWSTSKATSRPIFALFDSCKNCGRDWRIVKVKTKINHSRFSRTFPISDILFHCETRACQLRLVLKIEAKFRTFDTCKI